MKHKSNVPVITGTTVYANDELKYRKKQYDLYMLARVVFFTLGLIFAIYLHMRLVGLACIIISVPIPWIAVMLANEKVRPEKMRSFAASRHKNTATATATPRSELESQQQPQQEKPAIVGQY